MDLGQHAAVGQAEGQHAGRRPEAEDAHEDERPDQFGDAAQHGEQGAQAMVQPERANTARPGADFSHRQHARGQRRERHASSIASAMPAVAMASVSSVARARKPRNSCPRSGGRKAARKLPVVFRFCASKIAAGLNSATVNSGQSTTRASSSAVARPRAARVAQRMHAKRQRAPVRRAAHRRHAQRSALRWPASAVPRLPTHRVRAAGLR